MSIIGALFGTATEISPGDLKKELGPVLLDGEEIHTAFKVVRDLFVFTPHRLILVDKQGLTGKKVEYHSIPYKSISQFSVETAGFLDLDSELKIWISSNPVPLKKEFKSGTDIVRLQKTLAHYVLS